MNWFDVSKEGLRNLIQKRGLAFVVHEVLQNAWDEERCTHVTATLEMLPGSPYAALRVIDNSPDGWADLNHAFTLFAPSKKIGDATKRGRFNLGEKLVLALARKAHIVTMDGTVVFDEKGRHRHKQSRQTGTEIYAEIRMTRAEYAEVCREALKVLCPSGVTTTFNGQVLEPREPLVTFETTLPTEIADNEGTLRRTRRKTMVELVEVLDGEKATIYEMGIPVVEVDCAWHINVMQCVPLNMQRDNVTPAYLSLLRTMAVNHGHNLLDAEEAASAWVQDAAANSEIEAGAFRDVVQKQHGKKTVTFDPRDKEANLIAISKGYTVIKGRQMSKGAWDNMRRFRDEGVDIAPPAGRVTPSSSALMKEGKGIMTAIPERDWTDEQRIAVAFVKRMARLILDMPGLSVTIYPRSPGKSNAAASWGNGIIPEFSFYATKWRRRWTNVESLVSICIHEFAHFYEDNHLKSDFHDALERLGAKFTMLALKDPAAFTLPEVSRA